ncbi:hypothetical protein PS838_03732 [Pseudomonas fluorescens]|nr:hypothetical protein PS838_03732 [Pseudomonas fluorescens]
MMGRGTANGSGQGLHGDLTTTGAVCISSLPNATQGGRGVLRLGDKTTPCKQCGKAGVIIDSLPAMKWNGMGYRPCWTGRKSAAIARRAATGLLHRSKDRELPEQVLGQQPSQIAPQ